MNEFPERSPGANDASVVAVRSEVRRLMQRFGPAYFRDHDEARAFPEAFFQAVAERGYFGSLLPASYGGSDAGPAVASVILEEINRAGGEASAINAQMSICGALLRDGDEAQRARYLAGIARGEVRCLGVAATEPESGSDMRALKAKAERAGDDWIIDAHKVFISLAEHTRLLLLLVRAPEGPTLFLLDRDEVGASIELHPVPLIVNRLTTSLFIDGLRVPDRCRLGSPGAGLQCLMKSFPTRRIFAAAECLGNARFLLERCLAHAKERVVFERPIGVNQGVQYPIAQAYAHVEAADLMRWDALRELLGDRDAGPRSALARLLAAEACAQAGRAALTTFGGWALACEMHIERKLRESLVFAFNNLLWSYVAEHALGLPQ